MISSFRKNNSDKEKGVAIGIAIGAAAALLLSSKTVRKVVKRGSKRSGNKLKMLKDSSGDIASEASQKIKNAKEKVADKK